MRSIRVTDKSVQAVAQSAVLAAATGFVLSQDNFTINWEHSRSLRNVSKEFKSKVASRKHGSQY